MSALLASTYTAPKEWTPTCEAIAERAAQGYFWPGGTEDDVTQEARVGVWKAMHDYRPGTGPWEAFAFLCAHRQVITGLKAARRDKHRAINEALSTELKLGHEADDETIGERLLFRETDDPAVIVIARDEAVRLLRRMHCLSPWERECVERCSLLGEEYEAVGDRKSVDNALQRARHKLATEDAPTGRRGVLLIDRSAHPTERDAIREARKVVPHCTVTRLRKRKVRKGIVVATQGRRAADGTLGRPVWALDVTTSATQEAA